jgi:hypothetical protein
LDGNPSECGDTENGIARVDEVAIDDADTVGGMMRRCGNPANPRHIDIGIAADPWTMS